MAIVWPTTLGVEEYAAAGRDVAVPRLECPACGRAMGFWGWYERDLRVGRVWRVAIRRMRCAPCAFTCAVLPGFVAHGRLDGVEVIGPALQMVVVGHRGERAVAQVIDVAHTTVRDWRRRLRARASMLSVGFSRACVALGEVAPRLAGGTEEVVLGAIGAAWTAAKRRLGAAVGSLWSFANAVVGAQLLTANTDPPWAVA